MGEEAFIKKCALNKYGVKWIHLAQNRNQWLALVNTVVNHFLIRWVTISFTTAVIHAADWLVTQKKCDPDYTSHKGYQFPTIKELSYIIQNFQLQSATSHKLSRRAECNPASVNCRLRMTFFSRPGLSSCCICRLIAFPMYIIPDKFLHRPPGEIMGVQMSSLYVGTCAATPSLNTKYCALEATL
jgi:hypothetical protein